MSQVPSPTKSDLYRPLQFPDSFRVFEVTKPDRDGAISGKLVEHRLSCPPKYVALSYVWGPGITVSKGPSPFALRVTLGEALSEILFNPGGLDVSSLWIDQICVNQDEPGGEEKKAQVALMSKIYMKASIVIGWLGPHKNDSQKAINTLKFLSLGSLECKIPSCEADGVREEVEAELRHLTRDNNEFDPTAFFTDAFQKHAVSLVNRPWFHRRWIAQEACLASNLQLRCGSDIISGLRFFAAVGVIQGMITEPVIPQLHEPFSNVFQLRKLREEIQSKSPISFPYLAQRLSKLECGLVEDRLNALHGLAFRDHIFTPWFEPKYGSGVGLYTEFAIKHMEKHCSLEILHFAGVSDIADHIVERTDEVAGGVRIRIGRPVDDLPSWVPDWRVTTRPLPIRSAGETGSNPNESHRPSLSPDKSILNVRAKIQSESYCLDYSLPYLTRGLSIDDCLVMWFDAMLWKLYPKYHALLEHCRSFKKWVVAMESIEADINRILLPFVRTLIMGGLIQTVEHQQIPVSEAVGYFLNWCSVHLRPESDMPVDDSIAGNEKSCAFGYLVEEICRYRTFFITNGGRCGLGSIGITKGDQVCFFEGLRTPFVIRSKGDGKFILLGECYVDKLVDETTDNVLVRLV